MKNILTTTILGTALVFSGQALAGDGPLKAKKELIGYQTSSKTIADQDKARTFKKLDRNNNGRVTFQEFQAGATVNNEYALFERLDYNDSGFVDMREYVSFNKAKGDPLNDTDDRYMKRKDHRGQHMYNTPHRPEKTYNFNQ